MSFWVVVHRSAAAHLGQLEWAASLDHAHLERFVVVPSADGSHAAHPGSLPSGLQQQLLLSPRRSPMPQLRSWSSDYTELDSSKW